MATPNTEATPAASQDTGKNLSVDDLEKMARAGADEEFEDMNDIGEDDGSGRGDDFTPTEDEPTAKEKVEAEVTEEPAAKKVAEEPEAKAEEPETAEEEPEAKAQKERSKFIPRERFDQVNQRRKQAEEELARIKAQQEAAKQPDYDFDAKEKEFLRATLDGDTDKALALRKEIRIAERAAIQAEVQAPLQNVTAKVRAEMELTQAVKEITSKHEVFDPESDKYDEGITEETLALFDTYKGRGYTPADAMRKAASMIANEYGFAVPETKPSEPVAKAPAKKEPTADQRATKLDIAKKQPTQGVKAMANENAPDVDELSDDEFDQLPEATKRRMRGDVL